MVLWEEAVGHVFGILSKSDGTPKHVAHRPALKKPALMPELRPGDVGISDHLRGDLP
jgi:hypothetical protein